VQFGNAGQVLTGLKLEPGALVASTGRPRPASFRRVQDAIAALETIVSEERIDCDLQRTGHLQAAAKPSHFEAFKEEQALLARVFGHRVSLLSESDQGAELGARGYHGLLLDEDSRALNPAKYVHGLAAAAQRAGALIAENTAVGKMTRTGAGRTHHEWTIDTEAGQVRARDVLVATNGYTDHAAPALQRRLIPIGSYIITTAPLPPEAAARILPKRRMVFDSRYFLHYFRLTADNRLLFGGRAEFSGPTLESETRAVAILRRAMSSTFPELSATPIATRGAAASPSRAIRCRTRAAWTTCSCGRLLRSRRAMRHLGSLIARRWPANPRSSSLRRSTINSGRFRFTMAARGSFTRRPSLPLARLDQLT
jgi:glycine/D-amino acid oxidase-like deaminating enzyme